MTAPARGRRTAWQHVKHLAVLAVRLEIAIWQSLYRFLFRRPRVPDGATAFTYHRVVLPIIVTFIVVSAIELVAVDVLVQRWPLVRIPLLVLGIWGLTWMFGYLAAMVTRPHGVGPDGISVRYLAEIDALVPWDAIGRVVRRSQARADKAPRLVRDGDGAATLQLWMHDQTNVDIHLDRPLVVRMPDGDEEVSTIRLSADDATGFVTEVRRHHPSVVGPSGKAPRST